MPVQQNVKRLLYRCRSCESLSLAGYALSSESFSIVSV